MSGVCLITSVFSVLFMKCCGVEPLIHKENNTVQFLTRKESNSVQQRDHK